MSTKGPQIVDWAGIRAAAVAIGIRAAGRAAASQLPEYQQKRFVARVMRRASREGWLAEKEQALSAAASERGLIDEKGAETVDTIQPANAMPLSARVLSGSEIIQASTLSKLEKRQFLAKVVRTPLSEVSAGSVLCAEEIVIENERGTSRKIKAHDKLKAIELDAKLMGELSGEPATTNISIGLFGAM